MTQPTETRPTKTRPIETKRFDLTSRAFKADPFPTFAAMRDAGSVVETRIPLIGRIHIATSHAAVDDMLKDRKRFVSEPRNAGRPQKDLLPRWLPRSLRYMADNMLLRDEPDHRRLRSLVDQAFDRRAVGEMEGVIETACLRRLKAMEQSGTRDFIEGYARQVPLDAICALLGIPEGERDEFQKLARVLAGGSNAFMMLLGMLRLRKIIAFIDRQIETARDDPGSDPGRGLIGGLVNARAEGEQLSEDELRSTVMLLLVAGLETTSLLIGGAMMQREQWPSSKDEDAWRAFVEEMLRWQTPVQMTKPRFAAEDTMLDGIAVAKGTRLVACLASANSDPKVFPEPENFDPTRDNLNRHMAFSRGIHFCLGLQLARLEARVALQCIQERWPSARVEKAVWSKRLGTRGLQMLELLDKIR